MLLSLLAQRLWASRIPAAVSLVSRLRPFCHRYAAAWDLAVVTLQLERHPGSSQQRRAALVPIRPRIQSPRPHRRLGVFCRT